jgi:hypothetical protein
MTATISTLMAWQSWKVKENENVYVSVYMLYQSLAASYVFFLSGTIIDMLWFAFVLYRAYTHDVYQNVSLPIDSV